MVKFQEHFIYDHRPKGDVVVPIVYVANSFMEAFPEKQGFSNLHLVNGIILKNFPDIIPHFYWKESQGKLILVDEQGRIYYKALFCEDFDNCEPQLDLKQKNWQPPDYGFLFHGPMLQSLESVDYDIENHVAYATIRSSKHMNWEKKDWIIDPSLADGMFQLACLLGYQIHKKPSLPVKIGKCYVYGNNTENHAWCWVKFSKANKLGYTFDAYCFNSKQEALYTFSKNQAFFQL